MGVVSLFAWNWNVVLPVYSTNLFDGDAAQYGLLVSLFSVGAFIGGVYTTRVTRLGRRHLMRSGWATAGALLATAIAPTLFWAIGALILLGATGTAFTVGAQARIQLNVADAMSGRVMALYSVGFLGSKPLGGLLGGWITDAAGPRFAFGFGGAVCCIAIGVTMLLHRGQEAPGV